MENMITKIGGLLLIIVLGYILKRCGVFRSEDARILSKIIVNLTLPGALIASLASFSIEMNMLSVIAVAAIANCVLLLAAALISRGRDGATRALYMLNIPSYNIGTFVLPFVQSFLPAEGLLAVSMFDAGNNPMNSGGAYAVTSALIGGERMCVKTIASKMLHSVPFDTFLLMMIMGVSGLHFPPAVYTIAGMFGQANAFLAMLMIGLMFEIQLSRNALGDVVQIVGVRYAFGAVAAALCYCLLPLPESVRRVVTLSLLAPIPSVTLAYCDKCGCKPSIVGVIHSMCIAISLVSTLILMLVWK